MRIAPLSRSVRFRRHGPCRQENELQEEEQDGPCFDEWIPLSPKKELFEQAAPAGHPDECRFGRVAGPDG